MLSCPMCKKGLRGLEKECPTCRTDVSLLVDYVQGLQDGIKRAEVLTRAGQLGEAVWAYLEVLEVDPDNAIARRQVGRVATAVRQFDLAAPGRRWMRGLQHHNPWRRWLAHWVEEASATGCLLSLMWAIVVIAAIAVGYVVGSSSVPPPAPPAAQEIEAK